MDNIQTEIERRWILKNVPTIKWDKVIDIKQFYIPSINGMGNLRLRFNYDHNSGELINYETIIKANIGYGTNTEQHQDISKGDAFELLDKAESMIKKTRHIYCNNGFKFEVDKYKTINLVMLEVELNDLNQEIIFPALISNKIIMEVTGVKEFSNYSLSEPLPRNIS